MSKDDHNDCQHDDVQNNGEGWACIRCGDSFAPVAMLNEEAARIGSHNDDLIDTVTAVFSATLWDLHERAFEVYGTPHGQGGEVEEAICEKQGHKMDGQGVCERCGHSPFLGSE